MRPRGSAIGDELPAGVEKLLVDVMDDGFTLYCCGPKAAPNALVAGYEWHDYVDLLMIRDFDRVITARAPRQGHRMDLFAPEVVVWAYEGPPQHALSALLELVHPEHPDAPTFGYPAPAGLRVPRAQQRPMTIRLPVPDRAGVRAARLDSAMNSHGGESLLSAAVPSGSHGRRLVAG
ncbi:MAG: hypothetical protein ACRDRX_01160 [Pseudonocardiaceae bacterium]